MEKMANTHLQFQPLTVRLDSTLLTNHGWARQSFMPAYRTGRPTALIRNNLPPKAWMLAGFVRWTNPKRSPLPWRTIFSISIGDFTH